MFNIFSNHFLIHTFFSFIIVKFVLTAMLCLSIEINYVYPSKYLVVTSLSWFLHFRIHLFI